jgi:hypothetical protein
MKRGKLLVMGQERVVWEDQVQNALEALKTAPGKNDRALLRAIVEDWAARRMDEPMFAALMDEEPNAHKFGIPNTEPRPLKDGTYDGAKIPVVLSPEEKEDLRKVWAVPSAEELREGAKLKMEQAQRTEGMAI